MYYMIYFILIKELVKKYSGGGLEHLEMWSTKKHMTHPLPSG